MFIPRNRIRDDDVCWTGKGLTKECVNATPTPTRMLKYTVAAVCPLPLDSTFYHFLVTKIQLENASPPVAAGLTLAPINQFYSMFNL